MGTVANIAAVTVALSALLTTPRRATLMRLRDRIDDLERLVEELRGRLADAENQARALRSKPRRGRRDITA